jgi:hypothetical protein
MRFFDRFKKSEPMVPVEVEFTQEELDAIAVDREMTLSKIDISNPKAERGIVARSLANYSDALIPYDNDENRSTSEISEILDKGLQAKLKAYAVHNLPAFLLQAATQLEFIDKEKAIQTYQLFVDAQRSFRPDKIDRLFLAQMGEKFLDGERLIRTAQERIEMLTTTLSQVRSIRDEYSRGKNVQITMGDNLASAGRAAIEDLLTQEAIYAYNAVSGDTAKLTEYLNNPDARLDPYRAIIRLALNLPPEALDWAKTLREAYDEQYDFSYSLGTIESVLESFAARVYAPAAPRPKAQLRPTNARYPRPAWNVFEAILGRTNEVVEDVGRIPATMNAFDVYVMLNEEMAKANTKAKLREGLTRARIGCEFESDSIPAGYKALIGLDREFEEARSVGDPSSTIVRKYSYAVRDIIADELGDFLLTH